MSWLDRFLDTQDQYDNMKDWHDDHRKGSFLLAFGVLVYLIATIMLGG